jgi:hypothetical protein
LKNKKKNKRNGKKKKNKNKKNKTKTNKKKNKTKRKKQRGGKKGLKQAAGGDWSSCGTTGVNDTCLIVRASEINPNDDMECYDDD